MGGYLRQSTAASVKFGPFSDSTDGNTDETALTIQKADVRLSKNGGNMAAASADQGSSDVGAPHDEIGIYDGSLNTTDTNTVGTLEAFIHKSGALPVFHRWTVLSQSVYDALFGSAGFATASALTTVEGKIDTVDNVVDGIAAKTTNLPGDPADASDIKGATDAIASAIGGLNDISVSDIFTTKITESYSTKGEERTLADFVYEIAQRGQEAAVSSTTVTINQLDGTTPAFTLTMNDDTSPTSVTRAT